VECDVRASRRIEERLLKAINASLWTLPVEVRCYLATGLLLAAGLLRSWTLAALLVVLGGLQIFAPEFRLLGEMHAASNIFYFMFGALVFLLREKIPANWIFSLGLLIVGAAVFRAGGGAVVVGAGFGLSVLRVGLITPKVFDSARWLGDPSYGVYLWAFPIQQIVVESIHGVDPWGVTAVAGVLSLTAGVLSWRLVERRALAKADSAALLASRSISYVGRVVGERLTR
jgi:peptidoglycan/LPS O-acetylase OafA/YrhL